MADLHVISAGAAKGLVEALGAQWQRSRGAMVSARFGAVGAMKEALLSGEPCDVLILTQAMLEDLARQSVVIGATIRPLGRVYTGVAVPRGATSPDIHDADALRRALLGASAIYFPDPRRATAGIHFAKVLERLGLREQVEARLRSHPNGATAMREMVAAGDPGAIGCTQVTEILYTPGAALVGRLPGAFELSTIYSAAVCARSEADVPARGFVEALAGAEALPLREKGGFEPI